MLFSTYMEFLEGTDKEAAFFETFAEARQGLAEVPPNVKLGKIPFVGRMITAIIALVEAESIAAFRNTEHYEYLKDWNVKVHDGGFTMWPGDETIEKIAKVAVAIVGVIVALAVIRKLWKWRKKGR